MALRFHRAASTRYAQRFCRTVDIEALPLATGGMNPPGRRLARLTVKGVETMYHDDELPNGFQDADIEMAALIDAGDRAAALEKQGICTHGWLFAPAVGEAHCKECGQVFPNAQAAHAAAAEALR